MSVNMNLYIDRLAYWATVPDATGATTTWICCHGCGWAENVTSRASRYVNDDGFCKTCGEPADDPFDREAPYAWPHP